MELNRMHVEEEAIKNKVATTWQKRQAQLKGDELHELMKKKLTRYETTYERQRKG